MASRTLHPPARATAEYPKIGTLHCSWTQPVCWFATGIGANYAQDAIIAVSTATGQTLWRHELPAGIFIDNLAYDYITETLYSIAFRPDGVPGGYGAALVSYNGVTGNVTIVADLTRDFRNGKLYPGSFSICPTDKSASSKKRPPPVAPRVAPPPPPQPRAARRNPAPHPATSPPPPLLTTPPPPSDVHWH